MTATPISLDDLAFEACVGSGALTEVWRATTGKSEPVAIKRPKIFADAAASELIRREAGHLDSLRHPYIVRSLGLIEMDDNPCLALEYLEGGDLVPLLGAHPRHWVQAARDVAAALVYVHGSGVVHRDIKSRNVLFDSARRARLIDFGSAATVGSPGLGSAGTRAYQRLTQREGGSAAIEDDVHAFAVLLYELLEGRLPFGPEPSVDSLRLEPVPPRRRMGAPSGERALVEVVQEAMRFDYAAGPAGVRPILDALESIHSSYV